ncbi:hypothetical protein ACHAW5_007815 [Stephanodiscus triporus]|uniref:Uncharacterized protein n=1 Tax=Stephanodiscus triporus TaxID=2934178 RepID=A0ABD3NPR9_9STRA
MRVLSAIVAIVAIATNSADSAELMLKTRAHNLRTKYLSRRVVEEMSMSAPIFEAEMSMPNVDSMESRARNLQEMSMSAPIFEAEMSMQNLDSMESRARNLRTSLSNRRTETTDAIKCVWDENFEDAANHKKACKKLNNEHTVPYTCNGQYTKVCCTVSSIEMPIFKTFGTCQIVGSTADDVVGDMSMSMPEFIQTTTKPEATPTSTPTPGVFAPEVSGELQPIKEKKDKSQEKKDKSETKTKSETKPESEPEPESETEPESDPQPEFLLEPESETAASTITCAWKSKFEDSSPEEACSELDSEFSVPYECDKGKNVCCTVSDVDTAVFKSLGTCTKI